MLDTSYTLQATILAYGSLIHLFFVNHMFKLNGEYPMHFKQLPHKTGTMDIAMVTMLLLHS